MKKLWELWKKVGMVIGDLIASIFLTVFYFTIFALFAVPFQIVTAIQKKIPTSNFKEPRPARNDMERFRHEF